MANGQASKPVSDWQTVDANDWQDVNAKPPVSNAEPTQFEQERMSPVQLAPVQRAVAKAAGKPAPNMSDVEPTAEGNFVPKGSTVKALSDPRNLMDNVVYPGTGTMARGVGDLAHGKMAKGGHELMSGGFDALSTATPMALEEAPMAVGRAMLGGTAGSKIASKGTELLGGNPDQQAFAGDIGGIGGGIAGAGGPKAIKKLDTMSDPNKVFHSYLDPVASVPEKLPNIPDPVRNRLRTAMSRVSPQVAKRMDAGATTLGDLDDLRIEANRMGKSVYGQAGLAPDMARGMDNAASSMRETLYPRITDLHELPADSLSTIKRMEGVRQNVARNTPERGYDPVKYPMVALKKATLDYPRLAYARGRTLFESMKMPPPKPAFEGIGSEKPLSLPAGAYAARASEVPEQKLLGSEVLDGEYLPMSGRKALRGAVGMPESKMAKLKLLSGKKEQ